jgi:hypothetical protein
MLGAELIVVVAATAASALSISAEDRLKPEVSIEIGSPLKAEVKVGERSVDKLVDAVVDAFSPASEALGLLGDAVRLARVEVAARITRRAKSIADEAGLQLQAPPLKFLVPFFERASTEDDTDDDLMAMWANLLAAAGSNYDARQMRYTSILAELSGEQARILDAVARNYGGVIGDDPDARSLAYDLSESRLASELQRIRSEKPSDIHKKINDTICRPGVSVCTISFYIRSENRIHYFGGDEIYHPSKSLDFEILTSLGLLSKATVHAEPAKHAAKHADIGASLYHLSELGFHFWSACCGGPKPKAA